MGKIAFVFSGQGAQYSGMGRSLWEASPAARGVFETADRIRPGTSKQCFEGSAEDLALTRSTQPCVFCVDLAAAQALREAGVRPQFCAGFSLGELAAVTYAGILTPEEGFSLVCRRALFMDEAARKAPGGMAAVLRLPREKAEELCGEFSHVWPVNYNCPGQIAAAGVKEELAAFCEKVGEAGGKAVPLAVSGGFHSPLMESAAAALEKELEGLTLKAPELPVYANLTAAPYGDDGKRLLTEQVRNPVRWQETVEALAAQGTDTFIECGPGKTLSGLIRKTCRDAAVLRVEDGDTLRQTLEELRNRPQA